MLSKIQSRKFAVWLIWVIITAYSIIVTKAIEPTVISWFGTISLFYIGGNVAQKVLEKKPM